MPITAELLAFWGKANPSDASAAPYHPVVYHLLDVAAAVDALLDARPLTRERAAALLGLPKEETARLIVALVALHDLGKFTPSFQGKVPERWPPVLGPIAAARVAPSHHTQDGFVLWDRRLAAVVQERLWPIGGDTLRALAPAVFGHHGRPVRTAVGGPIVEQLFGDAGAHWATICAEALLDLLVPAPLVGTPPDERRSRLASWWLAGLTTVADWVGSHPEWFPYAAPIADDQTLERYWDRARELARRAVREAGLIPPLPAPRRSFAALTGHERPPTPAQAWASETPLPAGPLLVILEDVTGAGKTEAAQMLVHRLMADGRASGAYWAMPTQATANAMYGRQRKAIAALFADDERRPSLVLAHGQQRLHEGFRATVLGTASDAAAASNHEPGEEGEDLPGAVACAAFLADDRRAALLADIGAGTVDQALLGVLPSRFNTVRLFGLADKVLFADEAHAYDAYMGVELQQLLRFQAALGGCAVVLSATLSSRQREQMVTAWREGLDGGRRKLPRIGAAATPSPLRSDAYPLATVVSGAGVEEHSLQAASWSRRSVPVRLVHTLDEALRHVADAARGGAAVAWVRNTVDDCIRGAELLRSEGLEPIVFHARFAQYDRQRREADVLARFGPRASPDARAGRVVVATQVIEQSLDLDFDAMVSDLAPVDLLVQRAGRLRRHGARDGGRPAGLACELVVLAPEPLEEPPPGWLGGVFEATRRVYDDAGVLWRTVRVLDRVKAIATPGGLRELVECVYGTDEVPASLEREASRAQGKRGGHAAAATYATLKPADGYDGAAQEWLDDRKAPTRIDGDQVEIRLARVQPDGTLAPWALATEMAPRKAWALSALRVRAGRIPPGALVESRHVAAVDATRASWGRFEQDIPVVPLVEGPAGTWSGVVIHQERGDRVRLRYTTRHGLEFEAVAR